MEEPVVVSGSHLMRHPRHQRECGFTLIEVIVSMTILAIIGGAIAAIFSVGFEVLRPGGPQARLLGSHDLMVLEQALGKDGARAACVQTPASDTPYGSCRNGFAKLPDRDCPDGDLCFGWPQISDSSCHVAVYAIGSNTTALRTEYAISSSGSVSVVAASLPLAREVAVDIKVGAVAAVTPSGEAYSWVRTIPVSITTVGVTKGPSETLVLHPIATDPAGSASAITSAGNPC
jgi:prepilin-type N-terminal cleavage/methylation domain-containing protein